MIELITLPIVISMFFRVLRNLTAREKVLKKKAKTWTGREEKSESLTTSTAASRNFNVKKELGMGMLLCLTF